MSLVSLFVPCHLWRMTWYKDCVTNKECIDKLKADMHCIDECIHHLEVRVHNSEWMHRIEGALKEILETLRVCVAFQVTILHFLGKREFI